MNINNFNIEIERKNIKNINLKVYPSLKIKVSIPIDMDISILKRFIISKESWINSKLKMYEEQSRLTHRRYISGEDHFVNGKRYILKVYDSNAPKIKISNSKTLEMYVRKSSSIENKEKLLNKFYKDILEKKLVKFISEYENIINIKINGFVIRKMKNKWGSCDSERKVLNFNVELAKKKDSEIKYVVVHELLHLIEKKHNNHFKELISTYYPKWKNCQESLNQVLKENKIC